MSIFKREPRAVYRIYDEDEYLAGEGSDPSEPARSLGATDPEDISSPYVDRRPVDDPYGASLRRIVIVAVLVGVIVVVAVLAIGYVAHPQPRAPVVSSERPAGPARTPSRSSRSGPMRRLSPPATATRRSAHTTPSARRRRHFTGERRHNTLKPLRSELKDLSVPSQQGSSSTAPPSASSSQAQAEFGFER